MSDDFGIGAAAGVAGGGALGALVVALLKWSGSRNINSLDSTIKMLGETISKLTEELQKLREAHIGLAKDVGALQEANRSLAARIDGQGSFWHKTFEDFRQTIEEKTSRRVRGR